MRAGKERGEKSNLGRIRPTGRSPAPNSAPSRSTSWPKSPQADLQLLPNSSSHMGRGRRPRRPTARPRPAYFGVVHFGAPAPPLFRLCDPATLQPGRAAPRPTTSSPTSAPSNSRLGLNHALAQADVLYLGFESTSPGGLLLRLWPTPACTYTSARLR